MLEWTPDRDNKRVTNSASDRRTLTLWRVVAAMSGLGWLALLWITAQ